MSYLDDPLKDETKHGKYSIYFNKRVNESSTTLVYSLAPAEQKGLHKQALPPAYQMN